MKTIEEKATEHIDVLFPEVVGKFHKPWPEFKDALRTVYLAGAKEALQSQWHDFDREKPHVGQKVVWHSKVKTPKGTWLDSYLADTYDGEYTPENAWGWMPLPKLPQRKH